MAMVPAVIFFCTAVDAVSPTALACSSGETVILADIRAAAVDQSTRDLQRDGLRRIVLNKRLQCQRIEGRGRAVVGRCTYNGRDIAAAQVLAGYAEFRGDVMMATRDGRADRGS
jgi:hypothetical protein